MRAVLLLSLIAVALAQTNFFFAILDDNEISVYNTGSSQAIISEQPITGLAAGQDLLTGTFRPSNNGIYAVSINTLYSINPSTLVATSVGSLTGCALSNTVNYFASTNPVADAFRLAGSDGSNTRISFATGACTPDTAFNYVDGTTTTPNPAGVAYTNQVAAPSATAEYILDSNPTQNRFVQVTNPNGGELTNIVNIAGFTVDSDDTQIAFVTENGNNIGYAFIDGTLRSFTTAGVFTTVGSYAEDDADAFMVFPSSFVFPGTNTTTTTTTTTTGTGSGTTGTTGATGTTSGASVLAASAVVALVLAALL